MVPSVQRRSSRSAAARTSAGTGRQLRHRGDTRSLGLESQVQHLADAHDRMELHLLANLLGNLLEVGSVPLGQDDLAEARGVRGQDLLLEAADRQDASLE